MREFLKVLASILMILSGLVFVGGLIETFTSGGRGADFSEGVTVTSAAITALLLSGAVWLLADIAQSTLPGIPLKVSDSRPS